jgi:hypothetical protein
VLDDGVPIADALVLSHEEQLTRLAAEAPAALETAVVAGDPCHDRIVASLDFRRRYRDALGLGNRMLVFVSSTWSASSLLGTRPWLIRELLAELPRDSYVVATALHPNISHAHGPGQIRAWLSDCLRSGMVLLPELDGWQAGLIASDVVVGDHGAVTGYGAAIGRPVVLGSFGDDDLAAGTAISALGEVAPRLPPHGPYEPVLTTAMADDAVERFSAVRDLVTSLPGESMRVLRSVFARLLGLSEPEHEVPVETVPVPAVAGSVARPYADVVHCVVSDEVRRVRLVRRPAEVQRAPVGLHAPDDTDDVHIACSVDYPMRSLRDRAAVLVGQRRDAGDDPAGWLVEVLRRYPACVVAALIAGHTMVGMVRGYGRVTASSADAPNDTLPSAAYAWWSYGLSPGPMDLAVGRTRYSVSIENP